MVPPAGVRCRPAEPIVAGRAVAISYSSILNSGFLDLTSYYTVANGGVSPNTTVSAAYNLGAATPYTGAQNIYVAFILPRGGDATSLLSGDWAERQTAINIMSADGTLAQLTGAPQQLYSNTVSALQTFLGSNGVVFTQDDPANGYISSAENRTIWMSLTPAGFDLLFNTPLQVASTSSGESIIYWNENLSLPTSLLPSFAGLWVQPAAGPAVAALQGSSGTFQVGPQSPGNSASPPKADYPNVIASDYNFPLVYMPSHTSPSLPTGEIGLIEPGIGNAVTGSETFQSLLGTYRQEAVGLTGGTTTNTGVAQTSAINTYGLERSLDVGVVSTVVPNSNINLFAGAGVFESLQMAFSGSTATAPVVSSSYGFSYSLNPASPFYAAYSNLFVDAALNQVSAFVAVGDGGSSFQIPDGTVNLPMQQSPYAMYVGGTSLSDFRTAQTDTSLAPWLASALEGNLATIWGLVRGGLRQWTTGANPDANAIFIETVWNQYSLTTGNEFSPGFNVNATGSGGVDITQQTPSYQSAYGINYLANNPGAASSGRYAPDVSINAGGNHYYLVPNPNMGGDYISPRNNQPESALQSEYGTSAAAPMWASLVTQINAIFHDQGVPYNLGYANDLYYIAAAIAPASFNDITIGNNTSSYTLGGSTYYVNTSTNQTPVYEYITPTNLGYQALPGFDLTTGLGTPNGILLARALSTIAHSQLYFDLVPVLEQSGSTWTTSVGETLLIQSSVASGHHWGFSVSGEDYHFGGLPGQSFAWTAALAQQSLQPDFSPALVTMFDGYAQGGLHEVNVASGASIGITIGGAAAVAYQTALTSDYGFAQFAGADGMVEVVRSVAFATTAGGGSDEAAVVRLRQNGVNDSSVMFYKVDNFSGSIGALSPGDPGYEAAANLRAYATPHHSSPDTNGTPPMIQGPGYGAYAETKILGVDAGDYIAMKLVSNGQTYWAFASSNETVNGQSVAHLWGYGLNTWGWEDVYGGGDRDYNDLIVQLDFTSAAGSGVLV